MDQRECEVKDRELVCPATCQRFAPTGTCLHATQVRLREDMWLRPASTCVHACTHGFTSMIACMLARTQHFSMPRTAHLAPCACMRNVMHDSSTLAKSGYKFHVACCFVASSELCLTLHRISAGRTLARRQQSVRAVVANQKDMCRSMD